MNMTNPRSRRAEYQTVSRVRIERRHLARSEELISLTTAGADEGWLVRLVELATQALDIDVDDVGEGS